MTFAYQELIPFRHGDFTLIGGSPMGGSITVMSGYVVGFDGIHAAGELRGKRGTEAYY